MTDAQNTQVKHRSNVMAGIFYPENEAETMAALDSFGLRDGQAAPEGRAAAILAPHAGWDLSGTIAGAAFAAARGRKIATVVLLGPIHDGREEGVFLSDSAFFETPLGDIAVDAALNEELESCSTALAINDIPHLYEHSLEVLLPFVKYCFPESKLVPILTGGYRSSLVEALSRALDFVLGHRADSTLFVISSNLSEHPQDDLAQAQADLFLSLIGRKNPELLLEKTRRKELSACGIAAVAALVGSRLAAGWNPRVVSAAAIPALSAQASRAVRYAGIAFSGPQER